jgi:hypothetical protein
MTSRSSITMPSVEVMPTLRPRPLKMCAIIRAVVVLPLVPVTATIGTRLGGAGREQQVDHRLGDELRLADGRVGVHPEAGRGVDLADRAAGLAYREGDVRADEVDAGDVEPDDRAASSAMSTLSGCASKVRSIEMPPVDMLPVRASLTISSLGDGVHLEALLADQLDRLVVDGDPGQHLLVPDAAAGVGVGVSTSSATVCTPSPMTCAGTRSAIATMRRRPRAPGSPCPPRAFSTMHPAAPGLPRRSGRRPGARRRPQVEADAPAVVAVQRLDHHG